MNESARTVTFAPEDRGFVYAVARKIVGSADDADDVTQEALLQAYRYRDSFRGDSRYRTWLYRIAATAAFGHLRRQRRDRGKLVAGEHFLERHVDPHKSPQTLIEEAEDREIVRDALRQLPAPYRDVLLARSEAGEQEVASKLGISVANVKVRAHRARKQLRDHLEKSAA